MTIEYKPDNGLNADISVYRWRRASSPICEFTDVAPGDNIECSDPSGNKLSSDTYIAVNYNDMNRRRSTRRRRMKSYSYSKDGKSSSINGDCIGRFVTDCGVQLIGLTAYDCDDLSVISYIDIEGQFCNAEILDNTNNGINDYNHAFLNAENSFDNPLKVLNNLDPYIKYSLLGIMITFILLSFIACYICVARKNRDTAEKKKKEIEKAIQLSQVNKAKANQRVKKYKLKRPALAKVNTGENDEDDEDEIELDTIAEETKEDQFYDEQDIDNMDIFYDDQFDENEEEYVD